MKYAKIIADSITQRGHRLTTLEVIIPNIVVPEMLKHRMFSISSMSMRAVPFEKMVKWVEDNPFIPYAWQKKHKGMQGTEYITDKYEIENFEYDWNIAMKGAIYSAKSMYHNELSKQICNRLLFPFGYTKMIVTATEWENFFQQRCPKYWYEPEDKYFRSKKDFIAYAENAFRSLIYIKYEKWLKINKSTAEIHMQAVAEDIWDAIQESEPTLLKQYEWHIPYGDKINCQSEFEDKSTGFYGDNDEIEYAKMKIAIAKCARQSFDSEWSDDYSKDFELYERLKKDEHWVPFEHVAQVMDSQEYLSYIKGKLQVMNNENEESDDSIIYSDASSYGWADNFRGFMSVRFQIKNGLIE